MRKPFKITYGRVGNIVLKNDSVIYITSDDIIGFHKVRGKYHELG